jgi:hypothetical protein
MKSPRQSPKAKGGAMKSKCKWVRFEQERPQMKTIMSRHMFSSTERDNLWFSGAAVRQSRKRSRDLAHLIKDHQKQDGYVLIQEDGKLLSPHPRADKVKEKKVVVSDDDSCTNLGLQTDLQLRQTQAMIHHTIRYVVNHQKHDKDKDSTKSGESLARNYSQRCQQHVEQAVKRAEELERELHDDDDDDSFSGSSLTTHDLQPISKSTTLPSLIGQLSGKKRLVSIEGNGDLSKKSPVQPKKCLA